MNTFYGLVIQNGPSRSSRIDVQRRKMQDPLWLGGGVGAGGRDHAGNANWLTENQYPTLSDATLIGLPKSAYRLYQDQQKDIGFSQHQKLVAYDRSFYPEKQVPGKPVQKSYGDQDHPSLEHTGPHQPVGTVDSDTTTLKEKPNELPHTPGLTFPHSLIPMQLPKEDVSGELGSPHFPPHEIIDYGVVAQKTAMPSHKQSFDKPENLLASLSRHGKRVRTPFGKAQNVFHQPIIPELEDRLKDAENTLAVLKRSRVTGPVYVASGEPVASPSSAFLAVTPRKPGTNDLTFQKT